MQQGMGSKEKKKAAKPRVNDPKKEGDEYLPEKLETTKDKGKKKDLNADDDLDPDAIYRTISFPLNQKLFSQKCRFVIRNSNGVETEY